MFHLESYLEILNHSFNSWERNHGISFAKVTRLHLFVVRASISRSLGDLAATMKDFDTRDQREGEKSRSRINQEFVGEERAGVNKKGEFSRYSQTERKSRSLERILSYTIPVQVPSRTRHGKALKSPLKMTASPRVQGKVLGGRRWAAVVTAAARCAGYSDGSRTRGTKR